MKTAEEVAEALCRWFTPGEDISPNDYEHTRQVIRQCYADALRHAAGIVWEMQPENYADFTLVHSAYGRVASELEAEAARLEAK